MTRTLMAVLVASFASSLALRQARAGLTESLWQDCPCVGNLGELATISVPEGYRFTGRDGAARFMEMTQNPPSGRELGVVLWSSEQDSSFVVFEFADSGYVKDDEKDKLDAEAILTSIRKGNDEANKIRRSRGWPALNILGWQRRPFYDTFTNNLTWAIKAEDSQDKAEVVNYSVRLLGRGGVMHVDLVLAPTRLSVAVPEFNSLLQGFSFKPGHRYTEFRKGDKLASYGLTALIAGGAGAVAAKTGLLAKLWKLIVVGLFTAAAFLKRLFSAIFKPGEEKPSDHPKQV